VHLNETSQGWWWWWWW